MGLWSCNSDEPLFGVNTWGSEAALSRWRGIGHFDWVDACSLTAGFQVEFNVSKGS